MSIMTQIASIGLLILFLIFGIQFGILAIGSTDQGANVSSQYIEQYNAGRNASITTFGLMGNTPLLLGVLILITAISGFAVMMNIKRY